MPGCSPSIIKDGQVRNSSRNLKARPLAIPCSISSNQRAYSQPRKYSGNHGGVIVGWLPDASITSSPMGSRATYLVNGAASVGWGLLHHLTIKITPTDMPMGQSDLGNYSIEAFLLADSRRCHDDY